MAIALSSFLSKASPAVPFLMYDTDLRGGLRVVADQVTREAIGAAARVDGMLVYQQDTSTMYQLVGGTANVNFQVFDVSGNVSIGTGLVDNAGTIEVDAAYLNGAYAALSHNHAITDVTNLQTTLDAKAASVHAHNLSDGSDVVITTIADNNILQWDNTSSKWVNRDLATAGLAAVTHAHAISDVTGLQAALDAKAALSHAHATADITGLDTTLSGMATDIANNTTSIGTNATAITALQSATYTLDGLSDTTITTIADGDLIKWDQTSGKYINGSLASMDIASAAGLAAAVSDIGTNTTAIGNNSTAIGTLQTDVATLQGAAAPTLDGLSDTVITTVADGDIIKWDQTSSKYINGSLASMDIASAAALASLTTTVGTNTTNIAANTSDIAANATAISGKADAAHSHTFASLTAVPQVSAMPGVTVSAVAPLVGDGVDGDIWFVVP